jgi:hypothetical protein
MTRVKEKAGDMNSISLYRRRYDGPPVLDNPINIAPHFLLARGIVLRAKGHISGRPGQELYTLIESSKARGFGSLPWRMGKW